MTIPRIYLFYLRSVYTCFWDRCYYMELFKGANEEKI